MNIAFPLMVLPYVTRVLSVEAFGAANLALTTAMYFSTIASLGIPIYGIREVAKAKEKGNINYVVSELLMINAASVLVIFCVYLCVVQYFNVMRTDSVLYYIASLNLILSLFQIDWLFQGVGAFKVLALRGMISKILSLGMIYAFVNQPGDSDKYVFANVFALSAANLINIYYSSKYFRFIYNGVNIKRHLKSVVYFLSTRLMSTIYTVLDSIILGIVTNNYYVGLYSISMKLVRVVTTLINSILTVCFGDAVGLYENNKEKYFCYLHDLCALMIVISLPALIGIILYSENIILLFSGEDYRDAAFTLKILSLIVVLSILTSFIGVQILYVMNFEKYVAISLSIGAIMCLTVNGLLVNEYKHNGAAMATVSAEMGILIYQIILLKRKRVGLDFLFNIRNFKLLIASLIYAMLLLLLNFCMNMRSSYQEISAAILLTIIIYPICLLVVKEKIILSLVRKLRESNYNCIF